MQCNEKRQGKETHSLQELIEEGKSFEERELRKVFDNEYASSMRIPDLIDHFRNQAYKHGFTGDPKYRDTVKQLLALSRQIGGYINGVRGELGASKSLRRLRVPCIVMDNVCLAYGDETVEIDKFVMSQSCLNAIEVKFYTATTTIDECGIVKVGHGAGHGIYNLADRNRAREFVIEDVLSDVVDRSLLDGRIRSILCFANDRMEYVDEFQKCEVCRCGNLPFLIEEDELDDVFSMQQLEQMRDAILAHAVEPTYRLETNLEKLSEDIDYVLGLIAEDEHCRAGEVDQMEVTDGSETPSVNYCTEEESLDWSWMAYTIPAAALIVTASLIGPDIVRKASSWLRF